MGCLQGDPFQSPSRYPMRTLMQILSLTVMLHVLGLLCLRPIRARHTA